MWWWWFFSCVHWCAYKPWFKPKKCKKCLNKLLWTISHVFLNDYFLHMWPTLQVINLKPSEYKKSTKWLKKNSLFFCSPKDWIILLSKFSYGLSYNQMHAMNMAKHRCKHYLFIKFFLTSIAFHNTFLFILFIKRCNLTLDIISLKE
jgi:hypothetical protein